MTVRAVDCTEGRMTVRKSGNDVNRLAFISNNSTIIFINRPDMAQS